MTPDRKQYTVDGTQVTLASPMRRAHAAHRQQRLVEVVEHRAHPAREVLRIKVFDAGANEVLSAVAHGEADFGLNFVGASEPGIEFRPLLEERFVAACRRDHPLARLRKATWRDLAEHDFISVAKSSGTRCSSACRCPTWWSRAASA